MKLSRVLGKSRTETLQLLECEEELVHQLAFNAIEPIPNLWEWWATLFEAQVMGKKFNHLRWMPNHVREQTPQQIKNVFASLRHNRGNAGQ